MNKNNSNNETIELTLPVNAAYVSAARLTASSVANRLGFDIDEIEDIKAAVSEACTYIIKKYHSSSKNSFKIIFLMANDTLKISISLEDPVKLENTSEDMSLLMIKALMDEMQVDSSNNAELDIFMLKNHKQTSFAE